MISTHALTWSATFSTLARRIVYHFNSRTHVECDNFRTFVPPVPFSFQLTHSRGVRQFSDIRATCAFFISTHALTWSATIVLSCSHLSECNFNSRTHVECDRIDIQQLSVHNAISTHALTWSATWLDKLRRKPKTISTHALTWSATQIL